MVLLLCSVVLHRFLVADCFEESKLVLNLEFHVSSNVLGAETASSSSLALHGIVFCLCLFNLTHHLCFLLVLFGCLGDRLRLRECAVVELLHDAFSLLVNLFLPGS